MTTALSVSALNWLEQRPRRPKTCSPLLKIVLSWLWSVRHQSILHSFLWCSDFPLTSPLHVCSFPAAPPEPTLEQFSAATEGHPYIITCSVVHTCPTHPPTLTWSRTGEVFEVHKEVLRGYWEKRSTLTFIPGEEDDHKEITCTATFHGPKSSSKTLKVFVKRKFLSSQKVSSNLKYRFCIIKVVYYKQCF